MAMKKLVKVQEVEGDGLVGLMGERVTFYCARFIYTGVLVGVNESAAKLEEAAVVFDTGAFDNPKWATVEKIPGDGVWFVQLAGVESFGLLK